MEARAADGTVLELMCGTGRIGQPLVEAGVSYTGVDYCHKQLDQFQRKLDAFGGNARLVFGDARQFDLSDEEGCRQALEESREVLGALARYRYLLRQRGRQDVGHRRRAA